MIVPSTEYPVFCCLVHRVSHPATQNSQRPQAECSHATPTLCPTLGYATFGPTDTTSPAPSWPGHKGSLLFTGQSPSMAWTSVWQQPDLRIRTRISPVLGSGTEISLISNLSPCFWMTAAFIFSATLDSGRVEAIALLRTATERMIALFILREEEVRISFEAPYLVISETNYWQYIEEQLLAALRDTDVVSVTSNLGTLLTKTQIPDLDPGPRSLKRDLDFRPFRVELHVP